LDNAVVLDDENVVNSEGLRFPDEFVRHKAMDALGDLVTLGQPLMGHVVIYKAGHDMMSRFVKKILGTRENFKLMELGTDLTQSLEGRTAWALNTDEFQGATGPSTATE
jgi:UDP-3-O-[3-hydroxymyristoyl] N-acetylglucosamine deacetylase